MMKHPVVAVALSGGVDSLVTGFLLKQKYKHIFGIHFTTGYEKNPIDLSLLKDQLGMDIHEIDLAVPFEEKVVNYLTQTYLSGKTPNPCLICNEKIKFGDLLERACRLGADYLATGHYAGVVNAQTCTQQSGEPPYLIKGKDPVKDQSYFLARLSTKQLDKIILPLGELLKSQVKEIAGSEGIKPLHPSESQDICFIQDNNLARFILDREKQAPCPGPIVDTSGTIVGQHQGLHGFTIGQRRGINCPAPEPYYVKEIDIAANRLIVCFKKDLSTSAMQVGDIVWNHEKTDRIDQITTKIRYAHKGALSSLRFTQSKGDVVFEQPQNAVTPGQGAVFYQGNRVLGAGIIL